MKRIGKLNNNVRAGPELTNWLGKWKPNVNYFNILKKHKEQIVHLEIT